MENFKNLLVRNNWTEFNVIWQECCFGNFYQDCSSPRDTSKNMATGGGGGGRGLFSLYYYIEFKILLVRNHLTDFNIT